MDLVALLAELRWPILERIPLVGDLAVSPHGIGTAVGFATGAILMFRRAEQRGLGHTFVPDIREAVQDLLVRAAIGALLGARFFYVLSHLDQYAEDPASVFFVWEGGLTFLGGLAGAVLAALPQMRGRGYRAAQVLDSAAPGIAVGITIGRIGDLVIGDHLGDPAPGFPLAWRCTGNLWDRATNSFAFPAIPPEPGGALAGNTQGCFDVAVHQTALYDLIQGALLLVVLLWLERRPRWDGAFITLFVLWYGAARFVMDFLREDRRFLGLTGSQYASLTAVLVILALVALRRPWRRRPWAWDPPDFDHPWRRQDVEKAGQDTADRG